MAFIKDLLRTPDAQADPYAWSATLLAHAFLGVAMAALLPWWAPVLGYAAWEAVQWRRYSAGVADCLLDWCAVSLGVCVAVSLAAGQSAFGSILALGIVLLTGVRVRLLPPYPSLSALDASASAITETEIDKLFGVPAPLSKE